MLKPAHRWTMTAASEPMAREDFDATSGVGEIPVEIPVEIAGCGVYHTDIGNHCKRRVVLVPAG